MLALEPLNIEIEIDRMFKYNAEYLDVNQSKILLEPTG
jgi:hypothetical protein